MIFKLGSQHVEMILYMFTSGENGHKILMYKTVIREKRKQTTKLVEPVRVLTSQLILLGDAY